MRSAAGAGEHFQRWLAQMHAVVWRFHLPATASQQPCHRRDPGPVRGDREDAPTRWDKRLAPPRASCNVFGARCRRLGLHHTSPSGCRHDRAFVALCGQSSAVVRSNGYAMGGCLGKRSVQAEIGFPAGRNQRRPVSKLFQLLGRSMQFLHQRFGSAPLRLGRYCFCHGSLDGIAIA
jgi:hypothetical protein